MFYFRILLYASKRSKKLPSLNPFAAQTLIKSLQQGLHYHCGNHGLCKIIVCAASFVNLVLRLPHHHYMTS